MKRGLYAAIALGAIACAKQEDVAPPNAGDRAVTCRPISSSLIGSLASPPLPPAEVRVDAVSASPESVANAAHLIAGVRPRVRVCHRRALLESPKQAGTITIEATLAPNGEVAGAKTVAHDASITACTVACIEGAIRPLSFDPPGGSGGTIRASFVLEPPPPEKK